MFICLGEVIQMPPLPSEGAFRVAAQVHCPSITAVSKNIYITIGVRALHPSISLFANSWYRYSRPLLCPISKPVQ